MRRNVRHEDDVKPDRPEIIAYAFGLATVVFVAKGLLATFWQKIPVIGCFWILVGVASGIGCGWACVQVRKRNARTKTNNTSEGICR